MNDKKSHLPTPPPFAAHHLSATAAGFFFLPVGCGQRAGHGLSFWWQARASRIGDGHHVETYPSLIFPTTLVPQG